MQKPRMIVSVFFFFFHKVERIILKRVALSPQNTVYKSFFGLVCHIFSFPWTFTWWERIPQKFSRNITLPTSIYEIPIVQRKWGEFNKIVTTNQWQHLTFGNRSFCKSEHWFGYLEFSSSHWPPRRGSLVNEVLDVNLDGERGGTSHALTLCRQVLSEER